MKKLLLLLFFSFLISNYSVADSKEIEWAKLDKEIETEVCSNIKEKCYVVYSAYELDKNELPINNLHELAIEGKIIIEEDHEPFWGKGKDFKSNIISNPTWFDLAIIANQVIIVTGDYHHKFFEGFEIAKKENGIIYIVLFMGS